jgi:hypothetical protein
MTKTKQTFSPKRYVSAAMTAAAVFLVVPAHAQTVGAPQYGAQGQQSQVPTDLTPGDPVARTPGNPQTGAAAGIAPHGPGASGAPGTDMTTATGGTVGTAGDQQAAQPSQVETDLTPGDPVARTPGNPQTGAAAGVAPHGPGAATDATAGTADTAGTDITAGASMTGGATAGTAGAGMAGTGTAGTTDTVGTGTGAMGGAGTAGMTDAAGGGMAAQLEQETIREMQQALRDRGHEVGAIDGIWGQQTQSALRDFQQAQGMQASGQPDQQTLSALGVTTTAAGGQAGAGGPPRTGPDATRAVGSTGTTGAGGGTGEGTGTGTPR